MSLIYEPSEDSYLMQEVLKKYILNKDIRVLEIGTGSGILLQTLIDLDISPPKIVATDINPEAINHINKDFPKINCISSDLFENIKDKFDIIIFNPPYLPQDKEKQEDKESQLITTGGKKGSEIINKFLKQAQEYLTKQGKIFLLTSNLTEDINWLNYKKRLLEKKKIFFEELVVWELKL